MSLIGGSVVLVAGRSGGAADGAVAHEYVGGDVQTLRHLWDHGQGQGTLAVELVGDTGAVSDHRFEVAFFILVSPYCSCVPNHVVGDGSAWVKRCGARC